MPGRLSFLALLLLAAAAAAETITFERILVHPGTTPDRPATEVDPVDRARIDGTLDPSSWGELQAGADGWFAAEPRDLQWAHSEVEVVEESTWLLEAMGYADVYVNGERRIGNKYGYTEDWESWQPHFDFSVIPVRLKRGVNRFLFHGNRYGRLRARLTRTEEGISFNGRDLTLPDLVVGEPYEGLGAIVVVNATGETVSDAEIVARIGNAEAWVRGIGAVPPYGVRKVPFVLAAPARDSSDKAAVRLELKRNGVTVDEHACALDVKQPHENRRITFLSFIDGSVQYYGYLPAAGEPGPKALFLSLHGASVEAINQSGSYAPLSWGHVVAPTNRRPFGFSWEDWGRRDGMEVLRLAQSRFDIDPDRVYLTGHSMGGHGSWQLASHYPDRFAAVGPSAGWISLWSYRQNPVAPPDDPVTALVERATLPSRTLEMAPNLADLGVYVLHGGADDNVPPEQAHLMLDRLKEFHSDYVYHEEPDVGHWWDLSDDAGSDCVAWTPMFDFFARHRRPSLEEQRTVRFRTASPALNGWSRWAAVVAQQKPFVMSTIDLNRDAEWMRVTGTTENVAELMLAWGREGAVTVELDGQMLKAPAIGDRRIRLERRNGEWRVAGKRDPRHKGLANNGGFRSAFEDRPQLVYGTQGTAEENAWALAQARYDAEWIWYQGNGSVDVLPDVLFDPEAEPDRSVVLYGHSRMHEDWDALVDKAVDVDPGRLKVGKRKLDGEGLAMLAVRPRPGSDRASVGVVAATGETGRRLIQSRPYLRLGVAYPDVTVFEAGSAASTVIGAGFFGRDWGVKGGELAWVESE